MNETQKFYYEKIRHACAPEIKRYRALKFALLEARFSGKKAEALEIKTKHAKDEAYQGAMFCLEVEEHFLIARSLREAGSEARTLPEFFNKCIS